MEYYNSLYYMTNKTYNITDFFEIIRDIIEELETTEDVNILIRRLKTALSYAEDNVKS